MVVQLKQYLEENAKCGMFRSHINIQRKEIMVSVETLISRNHSSNGATQPILKRDTKNAMANLRKLSLSAN